MLDPQLLPLVQSQVGMFNPIIASGYANHEVSHVMAYIDGLFKSASNDFPEGLVYKGLTRVSPMTEYNALIKNRVYDISTSTVYVVKVNFEYNGEELRDQYILLPYLLDGGTMMISGSAFAISPVLIDNAFSVGVDSIFLYVNRAKLTFKQISHIYLENGNRTSDFTITADMYYGRNSTDVEAARLRPTYKMDLLAVHYLLAKHGIREMFKLVAGVDVWFGSSVDINPGKFSVGEFTICSSTKKKPNQLRVPNYSGSDFCLAIRTSDMTMATRCLIAGLFYVIDWYPDRIKYELLEDNKLWYHLLAITIKPEVAQEFATIEKLDDHFRSLKTFVDDQVRDTLRSSGLNVNDVFDILVDLVNTYPERINVDTSSLATMYNKRLVVLRYLMADVRNNIFKMGFDLQALTNGTKSFGKTEIENIMKKRLRPGTILKASSHPEVNPTSNPTDNLVPTMTLPIKLQSAMAKKRKGSKFVFTPALALSASIAEVGNLTSDAKDDFTGRSRLNPYVLVGPDGTIVRNPLLNEVIDKTERDISHD